MNERGSLGTRLIVSAAGASIVEQDGAWVLHAGSLATEYDDLGDALKAMNLLLPEYPNQVDVDYHVELDEARRTAKMLERYGCRVALELSTDDARLRQEALKDFRSGLAEVLVAVRTLDEGIDLPDAKLAVIVSGSHSLRQRLQRIGRVVRPTGEQAFVISLLARGTAEEIVVGDNDPLLLGNTRVARVFGVDQLGGVLGT